MVDDEYGGSLTVREITAIPRQYEITEAAPKIRVSLELALRFDPEIIAVTTEDGSSFIEFRAANGLLIYRIDGFDIGRAVLRCSLVHDGRTP